MFYESLKEGCFEGVLRCFKEVLSVFHVIFKEEIVSKVFSECFKGVSRKFQETFKVFQKSFMFYGTHRSFPSRRRACLKHLESFLKLPRDTFETL